MADIKAAVSSTLRGRGAPAGSCGVLLLEDAAEHAGGQYIWQQIVSELISGIDRQNKGLDSIQIIAVDWSPRDYEEILGVKSSMGKLDVNVLDCHSDPLGWIRGESGSLAACAGSNAVQIKDDLQELQDVMEKKNKQSVIILDSLTVLLLRYSLNQVLSFLQFIKQSQAALIMRVYKDAHLLHMVKAFECVSSTYIEMKSLTALQREFAGSVGAQMPFGSYAIKQKSQTGKVSVCQVWFTVDENSAVASFSPPEDLQPTAQQVAAARVKAQTADENEEQQALQSTLTKEMEGKMKLTLTEGEQRAKANVQLPYEKVQSEDVESSAKLGRIVYYRDSEEDYDSDEDPDDDLDI